MLTYQRLGDFIPEGKDSRNISVIEHWRSRYIPREYQVRTMYRVTGEKPVFKTKEQAREFLYSFPKTVRLNKRVEEIVALVIS